jgi:hypothetical protein
MEKQSVLYKTENEILSCFRKLSEENQLKLLSSAQLAYKTWESGTVRRLGCKVSALGADLEEAGQN